MLKNDTCSTVWETSLPLPLLNRGKVRDIYEAGKDKLLIVTTDRLSAFDVILPRPIPDKGKVLNQISLFWFKKFASLVSNHIITADIGRMGFEESFTKEFEKVLRGRSILVHRAQPLPVECVARGFITGSGWKDYQKTGAVCGHKLPAGLKQCQELKEPLFTPATKAVVGHDRNIDFSGYGFELTGGFDCLGGQLKAIAPIVTIINLRIITFFEISQRLTSIVLILILDFTTNLWE